MPFGKTFQIPGASAATGGSAPLGAYDHPATLEEGDQISSGSGVVQWTGAVPTKPAPAWIRQPPCDGLSAGTAPHRHQQMLGYFPNILCCGFDLNADRFKTA